MLVHLEALCDSLHVLINLCPKSTLLAAVFTISIQSGFPGPEHASLRFHKKTKRKQQIHELFMPLLLHERSSGRGQLDISECDSSPGTGPRALWVPHALPAPQGIQASGRLAGSHSLYCGATLWPFLLPPRQETTS